MMRAREGDLIETAEGLIFDVKGLVHPPVRIFAFPRYFQTAKGERRRGETAYGKVYSLLERRKMLEKRFPRYLVRDFVLDETLCEVPMADIVKHYDPVEKLQTLRASANLGSLERKAVQLAELLKERASVPWNSIGISGSILVGLHTTSSDIDPVVYGSDNCRKVHSALREFLKDEASPFKPYTQEDLKALFDFRSKDTVVLFEDFVRTESRKAQQGKFMGKNYFIRFVKDWNEITERYDDVSYRNVGYAKIEAAIADDSESIFTPCRYVVENVKVVEGLKLEPIAEIASFRGRFCEQAKRGETVIAQGKVERVSDRVQDREHCRLLLGNRPEDYMVLV
jgi:hypothetical protein